MKTQPGIFRGKMKFEKDFVMLPNDWLRDPNISYKAKGLLAYLYSHEPGYTIRFRQIISQTQDGERSVRAAMTELKDAGYLVTQRTTDARGYNAGLNYLLVDPKDPELQNPTLDNPTLENPTLDNAVALEDNITKKTTNKENNRESKASKISSDWKPSQAVIDDYQTKYKGLDHAKELTMFINYFESTGTARKSWDGSFRNWLIKSLEYKGIDNNAAPVKAEKPIFGRIK
jgi:hypothetical protein